MYKFLFIAILCIIGCSGCIQNDPSTYITDDSGKVHHTIHHLLDFRGRMHFPKQIGPQKQKLFVFDPTAFAFAAYDINGKRVLTGSASGGADNCPDDLDKQCRTVTGSFKIYSKRGANCLSGEYPVSTKGGAKMPYCMYFYRGFTIHGAYKVPTHNSSHGCIRVFPSAAKWLNEEFIGIGTKVMVLSYDKEDGDGDWLNKPEIMGSLNN
ncbi:MAG: L,D-transpeptidase [Legionellaceae bacterium]|nr:L,D-transpeptidase [Legionellaceae bacterium]